MFGFQSLRSSFCNTTKNVLLNNIKTNTRASYVPKAVSPLQWQYKYFSL